MQAWQVGTIPRKTGASIAWYGGSDLQAWQTCTQTMICFTCVKQKSMTGQKCFLLQAYKPYTSHALHVASLPRFHAI